MMNLFDCTGFDWDKANIEKNWQKHRVNPFECEEAFFNEPLYVYEDDKHSEKEARFYALGRTSAGRLLFIVFTIRGRLIRVISARNMSRKEKEEYKSL
jgi:uncharacterized DUF497 family protein